MTPRELTLRLGSNAGGVGETTNRAKRTITGVCSHMFVTRAP
jgi:hypothetical protein